MNFGLLLPQLPHLQEPGARYDAVLGLHSRKPNRFTMFFRPIATRMHALRGRNGCMSGDSTRTRVATSGAGVDANLREFECACSQGLPGDAR
ncbi:hypothetical protein [uncultured Ralstonia sp.]|jgi:hypothetical protein|uniref:hypothetical protein n=1 Tax=Ralstonia sp. TaxID=54061 RepID=UPI0025E733C2|nr:hypothetical protein [uncultured Ralstonia sp.]